MNNRSTTQKGFTLSELLVVIVVIAILAVLGIMAYDNVQGRANDAKRRQAAIDVRKNIELLIVKKGIKNTHSPKPIGEDGLCPKYGDGEDKVRIIIGRFDEGRMADNRGCNLHDMLTYNNLLPDEFWERIPKAKNFPRFSHTIMHCVRDGAYINQDGMYLGYAVENPTEDETRILQEAIDCMTKASGEQWVKAKKITVEDSIRARSNAAMKVNVHQIQ